MALDEFSPPVREWFNSTYDAPTAAQAQGWPAIAAGNHSLILAPTGSGKTLTAFLWGLDRLIRDPTPDDDPHTRIVYLSPLRALAVDVDRNLHAPLAGIIDAADELGITTSRPTVGVRTGDTTAQQRRQIARRPPDILITTPESLYLMLTSKAREGLTRVEAIIVDEIHALAGTKRGAHMSLSIERLEAMCKDSPQRIGLSATQRPLEETARFLAGRSDGRWRPVEIVDAGVRKDLDVQVVVPVEDLSDLGSVIELDPDAPKRRHPQRKSIWPSIQPKLLELIESHQSTLVFVNNRRLAERLATELNELAHELDGPAPDAITRSSEDDGLVEPIPLVRAHHGSISRERRSEIEAQLKAGLLRGLVTTSSLELGIDMGSIDLVAQIESPGAVSRGLQRIGRSGHNVGETSKGRIFPKHRADLLEAAVVADRMRKGLIESTYFLRNPLDVLAQQIVAMCALDDWPIDDLAVVVRSSANFADLTDDVLHNVLDMLAGRYPSEQFGELRPRIVWDRVDNTVRGRRGAQRLAVTNAGTIPDRGLFGVFLPDGTRVGELDEEMVYESRPGEVFLLGASSWRIEEITFERVIVTPAPGVPGKMPFWRGDGPGRPLELGEAIGAFIRESLERPDAQAWLENDVGLDRFAAGNLIAYLNDQAHATGSVPSDQTIVVERFRDEIGDWRVCLHSPFGAQVHAPWAMAIRSRLTEAHGTDVEMIWSDDGIVLRLPEHLDHLDPDIFTIDPDHIASIVIDELPNTALFASRFREAAGRALLLPRRRPDQRTPLWQQRQRAADLFKAARKHDDFPILLETIRECVNDVFDLPALRKVLAGMSDGSVDVVLAETPKASPFAQSLLFGWVAVYMYEYDAPIAERRAAALVLDRDLLRELLGSAELRELLNHDVMTAVEHELQRLTSGRKARDTDELHDLMRELGPLSLDELIDRSADPSLVRGHVDQLIAKRRAIRIAVDGETRVAAADDAGLLRDGAGHRVDDELPDVFLKPVPNAVERLVERYARTHGPFVTVDVARRLGINVTDLGPTLDALEAAGSLQRGDYRPGGSETEWCDPEVLRSLRRRSLAALRRRVQPVDGRALARFLPRWQGVGVARAGVDGLIDVLSILQGAALAMSTLERDVLAVRMADYQPADLDALCAAGDVLWVGAGALAKNDGRIQLVFRDQASLLLTDRSDPLDGALHNVLRVQLERRGASFWPDLLQACADARQSYDNATVLKALWELVWNGEVTNDSMAPLRAHIAGAVPVPKNTATGRRRRPRLGQLNAAGPRSAAGRWSLVEPLLIPRRTNTASAHARAMQLLERHGVLTREAVLAEGVTGGYAGLYPMLRALEDQGHVRRGYFVEGLGAAQFALPGAVDRLRRESKPMSAVALGAADPAQPFGATLAWPESAGRPARAAGALVVLHDGEPLVHIERGGKSMSSFANAAISSAWAPALAEAARAGRVRFELATIDGERAAASPLVEHLEGAGFVRGYRGWTLPV